MARNAPRTITSRSILDNLVLVADMAITTGSQSCPPPSYTIPEHLPNGRLRYDCDGGRRGQARVDERLHALPRTWRLKMPGCVAIRITADSTGLNAGQKENGEEAGEGRNLPRGRSAKRGTGDKRAPAARSSRNPRNLLSLSSCRRLYSGSLCFRRRPECAE